MGSLIVITGNAHAHRRRLWNRGLGKDAMTTHAQAAAEGVGRLRRQLDKAADAGTSVNMTMWIRFYGFDFMGNFAFVFYSHTPSCNVDLLQVLARSLGSSSPALTRWESGMLYPSPRCARSLTQHDVALTHYF